MEGKESVETEEPKVFLDSLEHQEVLDLQDSLDHLVMMDLLAHPDLMASKDHVERLVTWVVLENLEHLALQENLD